MHQLIVTRPPYLGAESHRDTADRCANIDPFDLDQTLAAKFIQDGIGCWRTRISPNAVVMFATNATGTRITVLPDDTAKTAAISPRGVRQYQT
jgi:hypothetical protein